MLCYIICVLSAFCTQFWSEYSSIPNAISLVSLGTALVIPSLEGTEGKYDWTGQAVGLIVMFAGLWQVCCVVLCLLCESTGGG